METRLTLLLASVMAATCAAPLSAADTNSDSTADSPQDRAKSGRHIEFVKTDSVEKSLLLQGRQHESLNVKAPTFAMKTDDNKFMMAIGGEINPILGYDIGNNLYSQPGAGISFVTAAIPVPAQKGHKGDFYINPLNGFLDLTVTGLAGTPDAITGYVKVGTNGINSGIVLQRAYVSWRNITAGMKLTLMQDALACQPPTIDPEGPSGCLSTVAYEVGYTSKSYKGWRFAAALDLPSFRSSNGYYWGKDYPLLDGKQLDISAEQYIPDIPVWVEYTFSPWNRIRVSGMLRNFHYRDRLADKTRYTPGWAVMLSGNLSPIKPLIFYYQFVYGRGIGTYLQDLAGQSLSYVPDDENPGKMKAAPMMGANLGVTYNINSKWQVNAMFSESRIWDVEDYATAPDSKSNYKYALYGAVNCFYNITPYLQWGIEYIWGRKVTWNMGGANDSRIQTQLAFTF